MWDVYGMRCWEAEDLVTVQWQVKDAVKDVDSQWDYWKLFNDIVDLLACTNEGGESA